MFEILQTNAPLISAVASVGTLAIWGVYLHILVLGHQRQLKPMLVINRAEQDGLDARCFVTNMSREPVHIQSMIAKVITPDEEHVAYITDAQDIREAGAPSGWEHLTRQGPLATGKMVDMGSYGCILDYVAKTHSDSDDFINCTLINDALALEISVLGLYGNDDLLMGASRTFDFDHTDGGLELRPQDVHTKQLTSTVERRQLAARLSEQL